VRFSFADKINISLQRDTFLQITIYIIWGAVLYTFLRGIINHLPILKDYTDEIIFIIFFVPILSSLPALIHKYCFFDYLFFVLLIAYYFASYIFFPDNAEKLTENILICIFLVFPYYFYGRVIDIDRSFDIFVLLSAVCIYLNIFYYIVYAPANKVIDEGTASDNMYASYLLMPHVVMMLWGTLDRFRIWKAFTFILGVMLMLSFGTRGPLVCIGFFGIIFFFFYMKFKGAIYVKLGIVGLIIIVLINLRDIIYFLAKTFTGLSLSTRILDKIITGDLGNDSYRGALRDILYSALDRGDYFWGMGLFGTSRFGINYPHFLPLDFFCTFGYLLGTIFLLLLVLLIGFALWTSRYTKSQVFIIFLISTSIIKLLFSSTFVNEPYFYMLIGACVSQVLLWRQKHVPSSTICTSKPSRTPRDQSYNGA
jgi:hypothetical protein